MSLAPRQVRVPAPYIVAPSGEFDGDDGDWATFTIQVGNPPQSFRVLPASIGQEVWIPGVGACKGPLLAISDCGDLRGANRYNGEPSRGFVWDGSTSWFQLGPYGLALSPKSSDEDDSAMFGQDTVSLGELPVPDSLPAVNQQIIGAVATVDVWVGNIGLGTQPVSFENAGVDTPSLLVSLRDQNLTTSLSYGYAVGKSYVSPAVEGSLILGGYDGARLDSESVSVPIDPTLNPQGLHISLHGIVATGTIDGSTQRLVMDPLVVNVNSAVTQIWLPEDACNYFEEAFGLEYDERTELYLINSTTHSQLRDNNPRLTFTVGSDDAADTTNIEFEYNAFDLEVGIPRYNESTNYFPLRRAAEPSQYTLGRVFLQEAYIIVDWERNNFTIGQAASTATDPDIIPMLPLSASISATSSSSSASSSASESSAPEKSGGGLSTGAIAGIAIAIIAMIAIGLAMFLFRLRKKRRQRKSDRSSTPLPDYEDHTNYSEPKPPYNPPADNTTSKNPNIHVNDLGPIHEMEGTPGFYSHEVHDNQVHELRGSQPHPFSRTGTGGSGELQGTPLMELPGFDASSELHGTDSKRLVQPSATHQPAIQSPYDDATAAAMASPRPGSLGSWGMPSPPLPSPPLSLGDDEARSLPSGLSSPTGRLSPRPGSGRFSEMLGSSGPTRSPPVSPPMQASGRMGGTRSPPMSPPVLSRLNSEEGTSGGGVLDASGRVVID